VLTTPEHAAHVGADEWLELAEKREESWWTEWAAWLGARSLTKVKAPEPRFGAICAAPGTYVFQD
jgi:polyhydroxyalkanoate synthase